MFIKQLYKFNNYINFMAFAELRIIIYNLIALFPFLIILNCHIV